MFLFRFSVIKGVFIDDSNKKVVFFDFLYSDIIKDGFYLLDISTLEDSEHCLKIIENTYFKNLYNIFKIYVFVPYYKRDYISEIYYEKYLEFDNSFYEKICDIKNSPLWNKCNMKYLVCEMDCSPGGIVRLHGFDGVFSLFTIYYKNNFNQEDIKNLRNSPYLILLHIV